MRCYFKGVLQNFHLLAILMRQCHTGEYQYDLVVEATETSAHWYNNQWCICYDWVRTRDALDCRNGNIFRIWCGAHQLNLIVKKAFNELMNEKILKTLTGVTSHLWRHQNLIQEMNSTCPTYATTQWISMGKVLKWLKANRVRLLLHFSAKKLACTPSTEWWLVVIIIQALVERIEKTFTAMQGMKTLVCEQRQLLMALEHDIKACCNIKGPMTNEETDAFSNAVTNDPLHGFQPYNYLVKKQEVVDSIDEVGGFVQISMDELRSSGNAHDMETHSNIVSMIANFSL